MKKLKYIGHHQPNEVVEVVEKKVKGLLASGMFELVDKPKVESKKPKKFSEEVEKLTNDLDEVNTLD